MATGSQASDSSSTPHSPQITSNHLSFQTIASSGQGVGYEFSSIEKKSYTTFLPSIDKRFTPLVSNLGTIAYVW
jgi:hypothetical protein